MYTTAAVVRAALSDGTVNALLESRYTDDPTQREAIIIPLIETAVTEAAGTIDGYLMARYTVPLQPTPAVIGNLAKDMAIYNLMTRVGIDEDSRDKVLVDRNAAAIRFLEKVSKGEIMLSAQVPGSSKPASQYGGMVSASPAVFSRDKMKGL